MQKKLLMGNEAFAHAALEAGVNVVAGYPGTPSSEVVETVAQLRAQGCAKDVYVEWSTNEKAAIEMLAGASYAGARTLFTCKQVGLNVASDPLMCVNYVGVRGGMVVFVADDPGPISSQTEQDTRRFASFAKVPVLDPANPEQGFAMMKVAFDLSEKYATPVIVRPTTRVDHASTYFEVQDETTARPLPEEGFVKDQSKWVIFPNRSYRAHEEIRVRLESIAQDFSSDPTYLAFNSIADFGEAPRIGIMAGGVSTAYSREALDLIARTAPQAGATMPAYRFMQVGTPYPFPVQRVEEFLQGLDVVVVVEELDHVLEDELLKLAGQRGLQVSVRGRLTGDMRTRGENDVDDLVVRFAKLFDQLAPEESSLQQAVASCAPYAYDDSEQALPVRPPSLCPGCPHRGSFYAVKKALGKREAVYCGDIGCYTMGNASPLETTDTCLCMGAGITVAQGLAVVEPQKKHVAFVGDSTFFASGITGCVNAVYNNHDITVCVLDNATTAMTGSQPHPGTGVTLMGDKHPGISIEGVLKAIGFQCIVRADPLNLQESVSAAQEAIDYPGPSAVLFESPCIQLKKPGESYGVNELTCIGCKACIKRIGCPAIGFDKDHQGPKSDGRGLPFVDASLCNGCGLCRQVCGALMPLHEIEECYAAESYTPDSCQEGGSCA